MAKEPCLCGDPACGSCGDPFAEACIAAEEKLCEALNEARVSPEEYMLVMNVGLAAVWGSRAVTKIVVEDRLAEDRMCRDYLDHHEPHLLDDLKENKDD